MQSGGSETRGTTASNAVSNSVMTGTEDTTASSLTRSESGTKTDTNTWNNEAGGSVSVRGT